jgi:hypothetical protein
MKALGRDIKAETYPAYALASTALTAGGGGDNVEIEGSALNLANLPKAESVVFELPCKAVLAETKTLVVTGKIQDSANGSTWADLVASAALLTLTGGTGGSTEYGVARVGVDVNKARQYVRVCATPNLSATATDTAVVGAGVAEFGGLQEMPQ